MQQLEGHDRVVRVPALELLEHRRQMCPLDVTHLRDYGRGGHEPLRANQIDRVGYLLIERFGYLGKRHKQAPLNV